MQAGAEGELRMVGDCDSKIHCVQINQVWFRVMSPSRYVCRDYEGVEIRYEPIIKRRVKSAKSKSGKIAYKVVDVVVDRKWTIIDGKKKATFVSLSEASLVLRKAITSLRDNSCDLTS